MLFLGTVIGGWVNTVDLRGKVVDDFTNDGVGSASLKHGIRSVVTSSDGSFEFPDLPKTSRLQVDAPGYFRTNAPTTQDEIRMNPISLTVVVQEAAVVPPNYIAKAEIRQNDKVVGTTNESGNTVISPHPGKDAQLLVCAPNFTPKTVPVHGVTLTVELVVGGSGCPPLPSPSPSASPSASPGASPPAPSPSPSPTSAP